MQHCKVGDLLKKIFLSQGNLNINETPSKQLICKIIIACLANGPCQYCKVGDLLKKIFLSQGNLNINETPSKQLICKIIIACLANGPCQYSLETLPKPSVIHDDLRKFFSFLMISGDIKKKTLVENCLITFCSTL